MFTSSSPSSFNRNLSGWCVTNIPTTPTAFANGANAWVLPKPVWGTCPTPTPTPTPTRTQTPTPTTTPTLTSRIGYTGIEHLCGGEECTSTFTVYGLDFPENYTPTIGSFYVDSVFSRVFTIYTEIPYQPGGFTMITTAYATCLDACTSINPTPTPTQTSTQTSTPTPTLIPGLGCSSGTISGTYSGNDFYIYPNQPVSSIVDSYINFSWGSVDRPNRFAVYDSTGLLWTSGWVGFADYAGPWGPSLNTPSTGNSTICFLSPSGRYVLVEAGNASPITPITDAYEYTLTCLGSCPGGVTSTPTATPTPTVTPPNSQATLAFSFTSNAGAVSLALNVISGTIIDNIGYYGNARGWTNLGCDTGQLLPDQFYNNTLFVPGMFTSTQIWESGLSVLSASLMSLIVNNEPVNLYDEYITLDNGHIYRIIGFGNCQTV
jgi:hypothetical protein